MRERLQQLPPRALQPVAGAGPEVGVRVVHRRVDEAVGVDHGSGLQVVGRDPLPLHREHRLGLVDEAAPLERERDVDPR